MMFGIDTETWSLGNEDDMTSLTPWRKDKFQVTTAAMVEWDVRNRIAPKATAYSIFSERYQDAPVARILMKRLEELAALSISSYPSPQLVGWNVMFDIAAISTETGFDLLDKFQWMDAMLLKAWVDPKYHRPGTTSLIEAATEYKCPWASDLAREKARQKSLRFNDNRLSQYCIADAAAAAWLWARMHRLLNPSKRLGLRIECACLVPVARSYMNGIIFDTQALDELRGEIHSKMQEMLDSGKIPPKEVIGSPAKLSQWLYEDLGMEVLFQTDKGAPSTDARALAFASTKNESVAMVREYKKLSTRMSKFIDSPIRSIEFCGSNVVHPRPKLFGTYTGRVTYSSKIQRKSKYQEGVAIHQWPRDKRFRKTIVPPEGKKIIELDFSGQEMRLMGIMSGDKKMREIFCKGGIGDAHSVTGAEIAGIDFEEFMRRKAAHELEIVGPRGYRYQGKFINLSLQYRTSARTLMVKALVDYDFEADYDTAERWHYLYHSLYPGVKRYWEKAIRFAKNQGMASTLGLRPTLTPTEYFYDQKYQWSVESTAINHPIQGSGADMKEYALAVLHKRFGEATFMLDLHDGLFFYADADIAEELGKDMRATINRIDWEARFNCSLHGITLPVDLAVGDTWGSLEEI